MATIGIDFGTSHSCVAVVRNGHPEVVPNEYGNPVTASYVSWDSASKIVVGDSAKDTASTNPKATISSLKAILGRRFRDPFVQSFKTSVQYPIVDQAGLPHVRLDYKSKDGKDVTLVSIESAASRLFAEFKRAAELHLRSPVKGAVVATPVYFGTSQRDALRRAAEAAGLQVIRMTHEPSAILTAYTLGKGSFTEPVNVAVVDFGAGSLQITVASIEEGVVDTKSVQGTPEIGGDIIDLRLLDHLIGKFHRLYGTDVRKDPPALRRLRTACERAKRQLSSLPSTEINIDNLSGGVNFVVTVTRRTLESLCADLFVSISETLKQSLGSAKLPPSSIQEVLLVGGSAKMPRVIDLVTNYFQRTPVYLENSGELVALGASLLSVPPDESPLAPAGVLALEVLDHSIGVETMGGVYVPIAKKNATLPLKQARTFSAASDDQTRFIVKVYEGEQPHVKKNTLLASFEVNNLPDQNGTDEPAHEIDVTVEVDENHHIKVYATHAPSNRNIGFELSDDVLLYDWSAQFLAGHPGGLKVVDQSVPWSPARWRAATLPVSRSTAPTPPPKSSSPDPAQLELEDYANRLREASAQLGDASNRALDFAKQAPQTNGVPPSRALPSVYHGRLMELRELCRFV